MSNLPPAPKWKRKALAEFVKHRPLMLVPVYNLDAKPSQPMKRRRGRPKGERRELSVMPDAERAFVEIQWLLKQRYPEQSKEAIDNMAFKLAADQFNIKAETLRKYYGRSSGERQRLSPRPTIT